MSGGPARAVRALRLALAFLTVIPIKLRDGEATDADVAASRFAFPIVGALIGLALAGLSEGLRRRGVDRSLAAFLLVASWAGLSGGLHLDGLADTADGLFLWGDAGRRLAAMRDPHVGSFGVSALVLDLIGKYAVLVSLPGRGRAWIVLGAALVARTLVLVSAGSARYARPEGTGRLMVEATTSRDARAAGLLVLVVGLGVAGGAGLIAAGATLILAWSLTRLAANKIGGVTGDTLGALVELGELTFLVVAALLALIGPTLPGFTIPSAG